MELTTLLIALNIIITIGTITSVFTRLNVKIAIIETHLEHLINERRQNNRRHASADTGE